MPSEIATTAGTEALVLSLRGSFHSRDRLAGHVDTERQPSVRELGVALACLGELQAVSEAIATSGTRLRPWQLWRQRRMRRQMRRQVVQSWPEVAVRRVRMASPLEIVIEVSSAIAGLLRP